MNISGTGSIPFNAARAYGINAPRPAQPAARPPAASPPVANTPVASPYASIPVQPTSSPDTVARLDPASSVQARTQKLQQNLLQLLAGTVDQPMDFDQASPMPASNAPLLPMYTRSADQVEAATSLHVGRSIDIRG